MKIHEYQAKEILKKYGVAVPDGIAATSVDEAANAAMKLQANGATLFVVKHKYMQVGVEKAELKRTMLKV